MRLHSSPASYGGGAGSAASSAANSAAEIAQGIQKGANIAMRVMGLVSVVSNGVGAGQNYAVGKAQAEVTETSKILAQLQQQLKESEDELQKILELIQNVFSNMVAILDSSTDTQKTIAMQMSQMA